jgi:protein-S-isoprenylcysteine O-methyltransferase Ste14
MAGRARALLGTLCFLFVAPGFIAGLVPFWITGWRLPGDFGSPPQIVGMVLIAAGLGSLLESFARFALEGRGTPAPPFPTERLVVAGQYRYVRNPMYLAVATIIAGQALRFESVPLLLYGVAIALCFHLFVLAYEEPTLRRRYGAEYERFCAHVPRWLPRLRPWHQS